MQRQAGDLDCAVTSGNGLQTVITDRVQILRLSRTARAQCAQRGRITRVELQVPVRAAFGDDRSLRDRAVEQTDPDSAGGLPRNGIVRRGISAGRCPLAIETGRIPTPGLRELLVKTVDQERAQKEDRDDTEHR